MAVVRTDSTANNNNNVRARGRDTSGGHAVVDVIFVYFVVISARPTMLTFRDACPRVWLSGARVVGRRTAARPISRYFGVRRQ